MKFLNTKTAVTLPLCTRCRVNVTANGGGICRRCLDRGVPLKYERPVGSAAVVLPTVRTGITGTYVGREWGT